MEFKDKLLRFKNIALVGMATSIYNEDSMTATQLTEECAKKTRECMQIVAELCDVVNNFVETVNISYTEEQQEINLTLKAKFEQIKTESIGCFTSMYHENAMSALELAGSVAQQVNECVRLINMMTDTMTELLTNLGLSYDELAQEITITGGDV